MRKSSARLLGGKAAAALALGVSLWMTGGIASATNTDVTDADNTTAATEVFGNNDGTIITAPNSATTNNTINIQLTNNSLGVACGSYYIVSDSVVTGNTVNIISGQVAGKSFQGFSDVGAVGGVSSTTNAMGNRVLISGGTVGGRIYGGWSLSGNAGGTGENEGNTVKIEGGTVTNSIVGGLAQGEGVNAGTADGNEITISSGGTVDTDVPIVGGNSLGGTATGNKVAISGGNVTAYSIYGAMAKSTAESNKVEILGGTVTATPDGIHGGYSTDGAVKSNEVIISGTANVTGDIYGGRATDGDVGADGAVNKVTVSDTAIVAGNVTGGFVNSTGDASYNEVNITGGTVGTAGTTEVYGGQTYYTDGAASHNTVSIKDATINSNVYGGSGGTASYNIVTIEKNTTGKSTTFTDGVGIHGGIATNGAASHNTVNVLAPVTVAGIIGGESASDASGNTLNLGATGITVTKGTAAGYGVRGFDTIAITDAVAWEAGATVLSGTSYDFAGGTLDITGATGLTSATGTGTMVLLSAEASNTFNGLKLKYGDGKTATLNATNRNVEVVPGGEQTVGTKGVTATYNGGAHTVKLISTLSDYNRVYYTISGGSGNVKNVTLGAVDWAAGTTALDATAYTFDTNTTLTDNLVLNFGDTKQDVASGSMTLLATNQSLASLSDALKNYSKTIESTYSFNPVAGVAVDAAIRGNAAASGNNIVATVANTASKLTFTDVTWGDGGALLDHSTAYANVDFNGAAVDTSNITFTDLTELKDGTKTLVSNFGTTVGTITGDKYKIGGGLEGSGKASLSGSDLIFTASSGDTATATEQTHNAVMGAEVGMGALSVGNDFIDAATDGLGLATNAGADGVSSFAKMGGGSIRQETGSHVDVHIWNAILALGHSNKKEKSTTEYGAFFEYGSGNYTTHNNDLRGDGSMHYTGGGLLAKWRKADGLYVEGSLRAGSVHDDARNLLRDAWDNPASYETNTPYFGAHIGVGKEIEVADGNTVDIYGKYFYNRKNSTSFNAGDNAYDLDAVTSSVLRVGARYTMKRERWNIYGGLAYEHEFDGEATGKVDGAAIRGADISGGSGRLEIGATMMPSAKSPWSLDLNVAGFAGKKQGVMGGVSVAFQF